MTLRGLDDLDRRILHALQRDARGVSSREVADIVGVSPSTVRKRIARLERTGVLAGYHAVVDYERAGYPLYVQIACTAPVRTREAASEAASAVSGVVGVRELSTGERNVLVTVVGQDTDDLTRVASALDECGLVVVDEELVRSDRSRPFDGFDPDSVQDSDRTAV